MSLHDKLAQKAKAMGKSSSEFTIAAQRHANATWFLVIAAVFVWYFWGWVWALIPIVSGVLTAFQSIRGTARGHSIINLSTKNNAL
jgi:hypothetical protein